MTKPILKKSPLVMALLDLRFTSLPKPTLEQGMELFRSKLFQNGFSVPHEAEVSQIEVAPKSDSEFAVQQHITKRWDYLNISRNQGVTLTNESLTLRSTVYNNFEEFKATWEVVITAFFEAFDGIEQAGMRRMGLRHMDAFIANEGNLLNEYINEDWLTPLQKNSDMNSFFFNRRIQNTDFGVLRVEIEERAPENGRLNILPRDISDPDPVSLKIEHKPHWQTPSQSKFAIVDIDHAWTANELQPLTKDNINSRLCGLYEENTQVFWSLLSEKAEQEWEKSFQ